MADKPKSAFEYEKNEDGVNSSTWRQARCVLGAAMVLAGGIALLDETRVLADQALAFRAHLGELGFERTQPLLGCGGVHIAAEALGQAQALALAG